MRIGVPTELKNNEQRVAITPAGVDVLVRRGHEVWVESGAGKGSRIGDDEYVRAGARIAPTADEVWATAELLVR
jgi:alanine dehydrogenase